MTRTLHPDVVNHYNEFFSFNSDSDWKTIEQRFDTLCLNPVTIQELANKLRQYFSAQNIHSWDDLTQHLPIGRTDADALYLDQARIRHTLQRSVQVEHLKKILNNFKTNRVVAVHWYRDENGHKVVWDGQHTILDLYFIAKYVFHLEDLHILVPNVYFPHITPDARDAYISNGSAEGKEWISEFEIIRQQYMAVEEAPKFQPLPEPEHLRIHTRVCLMHENGLYLTPFKDKDRYHYQTNGMFGRIPEFKDKSDKNNGALENYVNWYSQQEQSRPMIHWNAIIPCKYFQMMCKNTGASFTQDEIDQLLVFTKKFQHDFEGATWERNVKQVYDAWHQRVVYPVNHTSPKMQKNEHIYMNVFHGYLEHVCQADMRFWLPNTELNEQYVLTKTDFTGLR